MNNFSFYEFEKFMYKFRIIFIVGYSQVNSV